ncbi:MAG: hypothetical protein KDD25_02505, partial [Bdellovibrionales bacterium]|nr:hypothetical protein [Bdellovibrionales bacterium]
FPAQAENCRCNDPNQCACAKNSDVFKYNKASYKQRGPLVKKTYMGEYRGQDLTRIDVRMMTYDFDKNETRVVERMQYETNAEPFQFSGRTGNSYLIVSPDNLTNGVEEFVAWKQSMGYEVSVESLSSPNNTKENIQALIRSYYDAGKADFVVLIGDENSLPMFYVSTAGGSQTPSDLYYFTMGGQGDTIPDVYFSRIGASTADAARLELSKSIEFERGDHANSNGYSKVIGIASNEGSNPSDDEYITDIENAFVTEQAMNKTHFAQNSKDSTPQNLNATLSTGAFWMFYMGHGSGTSWPSMNKTYNVSDIKNINNANELKPIVIDVACQNGKVESNHLGSNLMSVFEVKPKGMTAYYGGTVNISWHPPAVMARAMAQAQAKNNFHHLGEVLFAGQMYLTENWTDKDDTVDNWEWYVLQGDPGLRVDRAY